MLLVKRWLIFRRDSNCRNKSVCVCCTTSSENAKATALGVLCQAFIKIYKLEYMKYSLAVTPLWSSLADGVVLLENPKGDNGLDVDKLKIVCGSIFETNNAKLKLFHEGKGEQRVAILKTAPMRTLYVDRQCSSPLQNCRVKQTCGHWVVKPCRWQQTRLPSGPLPPATPSRVLLWTWYSATHSRPVRTHT